MSGTAKPNPASILPGHFYFNRLPNLWNSMPLTDLNPSVAVTKSQTNELLLELKPLGPLTKEYLCARVVSVRLYLCYPISAPPNFCSSQFLLLPISAPLYILTNLVSFCCIYFNPPSLSSLFKVVSMDKSS